MTEQLVMDAAKVILAAGDAEPLFLSEVKAAIAAKTLGDYYTELMAAPRYLGDETVRVGVWRGTAGYRITTRYLGKTEDAARQMRKNTTAALEFVALTLAGGLVTTPVMFETGTDVAEEEDGWWSGSDDWTCTA